MGSAKCTCMQHGRKLCCHSPLQYTCTGKLPFSIVLCLAASEACGAVQMGMVTWHIPTSGVWLAARALRLDRGQQLPCRRCLAGC
jgi:hypothetical protein